MTAPIVTEHSRTPINLGEPTMLQIMEGDCSARLFLIRPVGQLWERVVEVQS